MESDIMVLFIIDVTGPQTKRISYKKAKNGQRFNNNFKVL